ncbi:STM4011 family radical SAM protein [Luteolibacter sp. Populi]|uniref:STM4011 family radical SAM protein n=1 Tax=Luteolibacter sp. Populi TaxID=3230487 RepID=UPI00346557AC
MNARWNILYRGPLSSCNYGCRYCPFAKKRNTPAELREDVLKLGRFVEWVEAQAPREFGVLFTPWGEALIHRAYREALLRLGEMPHVRRVAIQTNLACQLDWLGAAERGTVALWCTFHPTETSAAKFAAKIHRLRALGIRHSVGAVGVKEHLPVIEELRSLLPEDTYLWVNALKGKPRYYGQEHIDFLSAIDPLFPINLRQHASRGKACSAGHTSFTVDGDGVARRCHFIETPIGNIHDPDFPSRLAPRPCSKVICGCHLGYVHLEELGLQQVFGDGLLERIPDGFSRAAGSS